MIAIYQSRERANEAVDKIKIYAQPQRLMILSCLLDRERLSGVVAEQPKPAQKPSGGVGAAAFAKVI